MHMQPHLDITMKGVPVGNGDQQLHCGAAGLMFGPLAALMYYNP